MSIQRARTAWSRKGIWLIVILVAIGWLPVFVADLIRDVSPSLNSQYAPQHFAMDWVLITIVCSGLASFVGIGVAINVLWRIVMRRKTAQEDTP